MGMYRCRFLQNWH